MDLGKVATKCLKLHRSIGNDVILWLPGDRMSRLLYAYDDIRCCLNLSCTSESRIAPYESIYTSLFSLSDLALHLKMVALETIRASNARLHELGPGLVALFGTYLAYRSSELPSAN